MIDTSRAPWELTPEALAKVQQAPPEPPEPAREEDEPREPVGDLRRATWADLGLAGALALLAVLSVLFTCRGFGWSWDEAYYYAPAQMTAEWIGDFLENPRAAASRKTIDALWAGPNDPGTGRPVGIIELPSLVKWAMGISWALTRSWWGDMRALRLPAALAFGASVFLIYLLTLNSYRRRAAVIAAVAFLTMPRVFGHAHLGATETITNAVILFAIYCYFMGLRSPWGAVLFGVAYGLALDTKINAVLLAPVLLVWAHVFHRRAYVGNFFAMAFLAPLVWIALWPWLWHDTLPRLIDYFGFFLHHQQTAVFYLGKAWGWGRANTPWHYPTVMTLVTVPLPVLLFAICGVARTAAHARWEYRGILFTAFAAIVLLHASLPDAPKYDGTRLFFSLFPLLAILAGGGADSLVQLFPWNRPLHARADLRRVVAGLFILLLAGNGLWGIARSHPHELSYFNILTGGLRGARDRFETTYWGEALNEQVLAALNTLPEGANIQTLAMHGMTLLHLLEWGRLRKDLRIDAGPPYDYFLLQMRQGFFGRREAYLAERAPTRIFAFRGVPFFALYDREAAGEAAQ